ncbi:MAG TPA: hypothetical protein DIV47_01835 [Candidatus Pacebacteria bacterium]|nr:hypothetical protein [Candidatus Paceibacterota bacterium]
MSKALKSFPKILWLFVLVLTAVPILKHPQKFFSPTMIEFEGRQYSRSQYVRGEAARNKIDDATLYTYAGYTYIKGEDPTNINFEHPPLAKYWIGFSYLLTGNPALLNLVLFAAALVMVYYLAWRVIRDTNFALITVVIVGNLAILHDHVSEPLLDFPQLVAILGFFTCLFSNHRKKYLWAGITLGLLSSIKYLFPTVGLFFLIMLLWSLSERNIKAFVVGSVAAILTYLATYLVYFVHHPNPLDFIRFELFRFHWWIEGRNQPKFLIFQTLFTGQFKGWWAAVATEIAYGWSLSWPLMFVVQLLSGVFLFRQNKYALTLYGYAQAMMIYYAFGSASYARYLIPLLPFWAILSVWGSKHFIKATQKKRPAPSKLRARR